MKAFLITLMMGLSLSAYAGVGAGGGGTSVVCRDAAGSIRYAELLDLYEARTVEGFQLVNATGSLERDYYLSAARTYALQGSRRSRNKKGAAFTKTCSRSLRPS